MLKCNIPEENRKDVLLDVDLPLEIILNDNSPVGPKLSTTKTFIRIYDPKVIEEIEK